MCPAVGKYGFRRVESNSLVSGVRLSDAGIYMYGGGVYVVIYELYMDFTGKTVSNFLLCNF